MLKALGLDAYSDYVVDTYECDMLSDLMDLTEQEPDDLLKDCVDNDGNKLKPMHRKLFMKEFAPAAPTTPNQAPENHAPPAWNHAKGVAQPGAAVAQPLAKAHQKRINHALTTIISQLLVLTSLKELNIRGALLLRVAWRAASSVQERAEVRMGRPAALGHVLACIGNGRDDLLSEAVCEFAMGGGWLGLRLVSLPPSRSASSREWSFGDFCFLCEGGGTDLAVSTVLIPCVGMSIAFSMPLRMIVTSTLALGLLISASQIANYGVESVWLNPRLSGCPPCGASPPLSLLQPLLVSTPTLRTNLGSEVLRCSPGRFSRAWRAASVA